MKIIHGNPHITHPSTADELNTLEDEINATMDRDFYLSSSATHQCARDSWMRAFKDKFPEVSYATISRILTQRLDDEKEREVFEFLYTTPEWEQ